MANRTAVLTAFAAATGRNPMTVELMLRYLAKAGLIPKGKPGHRSVEFEIEPIKNVVLGCMGDQPSDAVEAVRVLNDLRCTTNTFANSDDHSGIAPVETGTMLGDYLSQLIVARMVRVETDYPDADPEDAPFLEPLQISMSINPPRAAVIRHPIGADRKAIIGKSHIEHFAGPDLTVLMGQNTPALYRNTYITVKLLYVAGKLLADTRAKQTAAPIPDPTPARAGDEVGTNDATPKKIEAVRSANQDGPALVEPISAPASTTAPAFRGAAASSSRTNKPWSLNKTELMGLEGGNQLPLSGTCDHPGGRMRDAGCGFLNL